MRQTLAIFTREMRSYFSSPVAYAVLAAFLFLTGLLYDQLLDSFLQFQYVLAQQAQRGQPTPPPNVNDFVVRSYLQFFVQIVPIAFLPLITMRLFPEEKRQGTMELLLTAPVTDVQIVLGKYLAALGFYVVMLMASFVHMVFVFVWGAPDLGPLLAGYLGLFLIGAAFLSLGLFISSLTESQIVAGVITFALSSLLYMVGFSSSLVGESLGRVLSYLSIVTHYQDFGKGVIDTKDVLYFVSLSVLGVFLTVRSVESLRWRG